MFVYLICYVISFFLARQHIYVLSGLVLIGAGIWLYLKDYRKNRMLIHLRGLFCLSFAGGQGISAFKLSRLQTDWAVETWACLAVAVVVFWAVFEILTRKFDGWTAADMQSVYRYFSSADSPLQAKRILIAMSVITGASALTFCFEAWKLGFIPMFSYGVPHAYSYFHVTGFHYITVSCVLVPSLFVIYAKMISRRGHGLTRDKGFWLAAALAVVAAAIPLLCVSRFQLILALGMAAFTLLSMSDDVNLLYIAGLVLFLVPAYLVLTVLRSHSVDYLNGIFEMKNSRMPIWITQPYIYIANNYDNFNCLVTQLARHAWGIKGLFPVWTLTGLKFMFPSLVSFPVFFTKEELTTLTLFYDAYYDFGIMGMALFGGLLGAGCYLVCRFRRKAACPVVHMFYGQIAMYMMLAFFTTWFSNPTTWFYMIVTGAVYLYVRS